MCGIPYVVDVFLRYQRKRIKIALKVGKKGLENPTNDEDYCGRAKANRGLLRYPKDP